MEEIFAAGLNRVPNFCNGYFVRVVVDFIVEDAKPEFHANNGVIFQGDFVALGFLEGAREELAPVVIVGGRQ